MHSWGCATRDGVCANASFSQVKNKKQVPFVIPVVGSVSVPLTDPVIKTNKFLDDGIGSV